MSAQETTSLETAIESHVTAPKPAKPAITAETAQRPQSESQAPGNSRSKTAAADPGPDSETTGKDKAEAPVTPDFERLTYNLGR